MPEHDMIKDIEIERYEESSTTFSYTEGGEYVEIEVNERKYLDKQKPDSYLYVKFLSDDPMAGRRTISTLPWQSDAHVQLEGNNPYFTAYAMYEDITHSIPKSVAKQILKLIEGRIDRKQYTADEQRSTKTSD